MRHPSHRAAIPGPRRRMTHGVRGTLCCVVGAWPVALVIPASERVPEIRTTQLRLSYDSAATLGLQCAVAPSAVWRHRDASLPSARPPSSHASR